jgi:hypothetical protein
VPYVWRFPITFIACIIVVSVLLPVIGTLLRMRSRSGNGAKRAVCLALAVFALICSPAATGWIIHELARACAIRIAFVDPSPALLLLPGAVVLLLLTLGHTLISAPENDRVARQWRFYLYAAGVTFLVLNCIDTCSPGWCSRLGFPFAYESWSDAMIDFDGRIEPWSRTGIILNLTVFGIGCFLLRRAYLRRAQDSRV